MTKQKLRTVIVGTFVQFDFSPYGSEDQGAGLKNLQVLRIGNNPTHGLFMNVFRFS